MSAHRKWLLALIPGLLLIAFSAFAQPNLVSGSVEGIWEAGEEYIVQDDDIFVEVGDSLIIDPGVQVTFFPGLGFTVYGTLIVNGAEEDSVTFRGNSPQGNPGDWLGITYQTTATGNMMYNTIILFGETNILIENGDPVFNGIRMFGAEDYGVRVNSGAPTFFNLEITNRADVDGGHSFFGDGGAPVVRGGKIHHANRDGHAMRFRAPCEPTIIDVEMYGGRDYGIFGEDLASGTFSYNNIHHFGVRGIHLDGCSNSTLYRNSIRETTGSGMFIQGGFNINVL
ncbi:right-handed parallel beta-helix repeat-containing protein, partial [bacterium]|nr:right-handed parallel beta-helix repeat-containing protein [bacterium]